MKWCINGRRQGKTTEAVQEFQKKENAVLLVRNLAEKNRICAEYGIPYHRVMLHGDLIYCEKLLGCGRTPLIIDNLEFLISEIAAKADAYVY